MTEPIQYDFEFVVLAKSPWIAPIAKALAAFFYCLAVIGAVALHVVAAFALLFPDSAQSRIFFAAYQGGMISIAHLAVLAIASSLVSGLYRCKESMRVRARRSADEIVPDVAQQPRRGRDTGSW